MSGNAAGVFQAKARECEKHAAAMLAAEQRLVSCLPFSAQTLRDADVVTRAFVDQYVHRFSKLQDATGNSRNSRFSWLSNSRAEASRTS